MTRLWARVLRGDVPSLDRVPGVIERPQDFWGIPHLNLVTQRVMLATGREAELVALYDGAFGSPEQMTTILLFMELAPGVAIALREVGRHDEAGRLLALADRQIRAVMARGRAPAEF